MDPVKKNPKLGPLAIMCALVGGLGLAMIFGACLVLVASFAARDDLNYALSEAAGAIRLGFVGLVLLLPYAWYAARNRRKW